MSKRAHRSSLGILAVAALIAMPGLAQDLATVDIDPTGIAFSGLAHDGGFTLTVSAPDGVVHSFSFPAGTPPYFDLAGGAFGDGAYTWELRPIAAPRSRVGNLGLGVTPKVLQSGGFTVVGGAIATGGVEAKSVNDGSGGPLAKDQVITDDLIVNGGSLCVGQDCVNGESFGFDTLRLKENNLRIHFQDTSNSASFPTNDWRIDVNDSSNGGQNRFSIQDSDAGNFPFTIEAGAGANALYVDDGGRIGLGTATPVVELHIKDGDTPTIRLEQDGSSGFTAQTWDVAGNETNYFIRDATNGSTLPFRIRPGAPTSAIDVAGGGNVGMGTSAPGSALHVVRTNQTAAIEVESSSSNSAHEAQVVVRSNEGASRLSLNNGTDNNYRLPSANNGDFVINLGGAGTNPLTLTAAGDLTVLGTVTPMSDRNAKESFEAVDAQAVLDRLLTLPITTWSYKADEKKARHLGPVAQDFFAAFELGGSAKGISVTDSAGVAFAAIQALHAQVEEKEAENAELAARLARLEALVEAIAAAND